MGTIESTDLDAAQALGVALSVAAPLMVMEDAQRAAPDMLDHLHRIGFDVTLTEAPPLGSVLRELDACKPLYNATGPAQGGRTFSGYEVPGWLMLRVRAALAEESER